MNYIKINKSFTYEILKSVLFDDDRESIKSLLSGKLDLEILDSAMNDMPSGVLNGLSLRKFIKLKEKKFIRNYVKSKSYVKQEKACLNSEDAKLFYKIYYAVLEFTNVKFNIKPKYNVYKDGFNTTELSLITEAFWNNRNSLIDEFCLTNPYDFCDLELELVYEFKKSIRNVFIIIEFLKDYTAFMSFDKVYMVKGINFNIDEIIDVSDLPVGIYVTILPFKNYIVFDGVMLQIEINASYGFEDVLDDIYNNLDKYYNL